MEKLKRFFRRFRSLYWQQFALTAGMVLLTLVLLGASFYTLSYSYTLSEKRGEMRDRAQLVAQLSADFFRAGAGDSGDQEDSLRKLAGVASVMSDAYFLICNDQGAVLLSSDERLVGRTLTVPEDIMSEILEVDGLYEGRSTVGTAYESKQFVVGVPVPGSDQPTGVVLAVMDAGELMEMWRSFIALFFMTAAG